MKRIKSGEEEGCSATCRHELAGVVVLGRLHDCNLGPNVGGGD
jgi:hypothetical protein